MGKKQKFIQYAANSRPTPILTGKAAERFLQMAQENEEKAKNPTPEMIAELDRIKSLWEKMKANSPYLQNNH